MKRAVAAAKINLSLAVGPVRDDGLHELTSVFQRIDIVDRVAVGVGAAEPQTVTVEGFADDTLVLGALHALIDATGFANSLHAGIDKEIPVAAGLGGGSADAGATLQLGNELLDRPLPEGELRALAFELGADVPFFTTCGPRLVEGAGERLTPIDVPQDYWVVVALPHDVEKPSTGEIYRRFGERGGERGYAERRTALLAALAQCARASDLAALPGNDLAPHTGSELLVRELLERRAFRADVSGAGPAVYGLFQHERHARDALDGLSGARDAWLTVPVW